MQKYDIWQISQAKMSEEEVKHTGEKQDEVSLWQVIKQYDIVVN